MKIIAGVTLILLSTLARAGEFRSVPWGASKEQVAKTEHGKKTAEAADGLQYSVDVLSFPADAAYLFNKNKLYRGAYLFKERHSNKTDFVGDYEKVKSALTAKYGKPSKEGVNWKNPLYQDDPAHYGLAIAMGHVAYIAEWDLADTVVRLGLNGDNFKISFILYCEDPGVGKEADKEKATKDLKDL